MNCFLTFLNYSVYFFYKKVENINVYHVLCVLFRIVYSIRDYQIKLENVRPSCRTSTNQYLGAHFHQFGFFSSEHRCQLKCQLRSASINTGYANEKKFEVFYLHLQQQTVTVYFFRTGIVRICFIIFPSFLHLFSSHCLVLLTNSVSFSLF